MNKYKVCVYGICKNEEKFVKRWYESMKEADAIFVLDTGSTDNTVKLLKEFGVNVRTSKIEPWRFDVARNKSLDLIPDDYDICVCTDLDEVFEKGWRKYLEDSWVGSTSRARYNYNWSLDDNNRPLVNFYTDKIHQRKNYKWTHPVHEVLTFLGDKENIITIDNEGDLCLDDGLSIRDNKDGTYTLFVHLANPASIIPYASSTMKEALKRCNTLYLLDDSIPIFDSYLSDHILSLLPNKYTNALTVKVNIDTDYSLILDTLEIIPSIIQSKHKLSYEETDDIINHGGDLNSTLMLLSRIFDKQATDNPKISAYHKLENIIRGRDNTNSSKADTSISHMMVEQSNVFANSTIYLIEKRDNLGLIMPWRVQTEDCDELINEYLKRGNFDTTNKELRRMMKEYMMRSKYSFVNGGHYGLGLGGYVRISSAARRAMDALAIYVLYDLYINRNSDDLDYKYYYWEKEIKYWCEYANIRTSENNNFISEYNYLCSRGKILKK